MGERRREKPEGMQEQYGSCRFCGQMKMFHTMEPWSDEKLNDAATEECECEGARAFTKRKKAMKKAVEAIESLFSEKSILHVLYHVTLDPDVKEHLIQNVVLIYEEKLRSSVHTEGRVKIRISGRSDGDIKVKWTYTDEGEEKTK